MFMFHALLIVIVVLVCSLAGFIIPRNTKFQNMVMSRVTCWPCSTGFLSPSSTSLGFATCDLIHWLLVSQCIEFRISGWIWRFQIGSAQRTCGSFVALGLPKIWHPLKSSLCISRGICSFFCRHFHDPR